MHASDIGWGGGGDSLRVEEGGREAGIHLYLGNSVSNSKILANYLFVVGGPTHPRANEVPLFLVGREEEGGRKRPNQLRWHASSDGLS